MNEKTIKQWLESDIDYAASIIASLLKDGTTIEALSAEIQADLESEVYLLFSTEAPRCWLNH